MGKLLIIGKVPPPIGGVTIHVQRLMQSLDQAEVLYEFQVLDKGNLTSILYGIKRSDLFHLHTSNSYIRLALLLWSKLLGKKSIFTLHGNLMRYSYVKNTLDKWAIRIANMPIVINKGSFQLAKKLNPNTQLLSAFIPPVVVQALDETLQNALDLFTKKYDRIFCTNAFNLSFDVDKHEIYGISDLIKIFQQETEIGLIFSDPSSNYQTFLEKKGIEIPENVYLINFPHDFINVLKMSDGFIRATTTDGDSLSVKEALFYGKTTICSDCVSRPKGCLLYKTRDNEDLRKKIVASATVDDRTENEIQNAYLQLKKIYELLNT